MSEDPNKKYNESYAQSRGLKYVPGTNQPVGWAKDRNKMDADSSANKGGCFVATAAYGDYNAPEVVFLRSFRDMTLLNTFLGRVFVRAYYSASPPLAAVIAKSKLLRGFVRRFFLRPIIYVINASVGTKFE